jgi:hypothetical protein
MLDIVQPRRRHDAVRPHPHHPLGDPPPVSKERDLWTIALSWRRSCRDAGRPRAAAQSQKDMRWWAKPLMGGSPRQAQALRPHVVVLDLAMPR